MTIKELKRFQRKKKTATNLGMYLLAIEAWARTPRFLRWIAGSVTLGLIVATIAYWYIVLPMLGVYMIYRAWKRIEERYYWWLQDRKHPTKQDIPF